MGLFENSVGVCAIPNVCYLKIPLSSLFISKGFFLLFNFVSSGFDFVWILTNWDFLSGGFIAVETSEGDALLSSDA